MQELRDELFGEEHEIMRVSSQISDRLAASFFTTPSSRAGQLQEAVNEELKASEETSATLLSNLAALQHVVLPQKAHENLTQSSAASKQVSLRCLLIPGCGTPL
jgi:hypothetical protein